jgi:hypothetical protein
MAICRLDARARLNRPRHARLGAPPRCRSNGGSRARRARAASAARSREPDPRSPRGRTCQVMPGTVICASRARQPVARLEQAQRVAFVGYDAAAWCIGRGRPGDTRARLQDDVGDPDHRCGERPSPIGGLICPTPCRRGGRRRLGLRRRSTGTAGHHRGRIGVPVGARAFAGDPARSSTSLRAARVEAPHLPPCGTRWPPCPRRGSRGSPNSSASAISTTKPTPRPRSTRARCRRRT